ncbi:hypothetical protein EVAR_51020_1 [Eumeta japonica]|uniref:Uncharacterized protein n=1 Tax=Eumeta variegata TaxID=151549 RepID=A0A4C1Y3F2_EUMVA|nr:hypothetical protein EVAR_51020_1 [Eumeta japonica]
MWLALFPGARVPVTHSLPSPHSIQFHHFTPLPLPYSNNLPPPNILIETKRLLPHALVTPLGLQVSADNGSCGHEKGSLRRTRHSVVRNKAQELDCRWIRLRLRSPGYIRSQPLGRS